MMNHKEYFLLPYGSLTNEGFRFVAEMILNQDGEEIPGVVMPPGDYIDPSKIGVTAKISKRSNGIVLTDLKVLTNGHDVKLHREVEIQEGIAIKRLLDMGMSPKPVFTGTVNKKLRIVMDCRIMGFYIGPSKRLKSGVIE